MGRGRPKKKDKLTRAEISRNYRQKKKLKDPDGVKRCKIFLDDTIIKTTPLRKKPFQGWRYLKKNRTPADIAAPVTGTFEDDIPL